MMKKWAVFCRPLFNTVGTKFKGNTLIETFNEFEKFTGFSYMGTGAFSGCVNLREIELPTTLVATCLNQTNISDETFCKTALTTIDLKNVTRMGSNTFKECPNLSHIDLKKIQYFASDVFRFTLQLTRLIVPNVIGETQSFHLTNFAYGSHKLTLIDFGPSMAVCGNYLRYMSNSTYGNPPSGWSNVTVVFRSKSFVLRSGKQALQGSWRCYCTEEMYDYLKNSSNQSYPGMVYLIGGEEWVEQYGSADPYANLTPEEKAYYYPDAE